MTMPFPKRFWSKTVLLTALVGGSLVAASCWASSPSETPDEATETPVIELAKETPLDAFKHFLVVTVEYVGDWTNRLLKRDTPTERAVEVAPAVLPPKAMTSRADISAAPTFTPYTVQPDIRNRTEVARALEQAYPPLLRDAGIGGTAQVWFFIDDTGVVRKTKLNKPTGHPALDEAALEVARAIRFTPAMNRDEPVPVWISLPITFRVR